MFKSALIKLTGVYLFILMAVSIAFSFNLYRISTGEVGSRLRRQVDFFARDPSLSYFVPDISPFERERINELDASRRHVIAELVYANMFILIVGGVGSYMLARITLRPIEEAHAAQARFTADASHELRTPLAAMRAETEVALRDPSLTLEEAREQLASNLEELARLSDLSEGLLQLARGDVDDAVREPVAVSDLIELAVEHVASPASQKHISITVSKLPQAEVLGDGRQLKQAVVILLDNAIKYSEPKTTISIKAFKRDGTAKITVTDQGKGIDDADLPHIFDRFYRADTARSQANVSGHGLGLAIAQQVVSQHGGTMDVSSKLGNGSTFTISLPIHSA